MAEESFLNQIDTAIGDFFAQWNVGSTILVGVLIIVLVYPLFITAEPDIHPFLLARQAAPSPIRHPGESGTYRSTEIPYGYPLRSGLAIKDPGTNKWVTGRDGDLRDVWRQAVNGSSQEGVTNSSPTAKISTILGTEKVVQHDLGDVTKEINVIGKYLQDAGAKKIAVCLSNSVELLETIFASSFYGFPLTLIPHSQDSDETTDLLSKSTFDTLIAEAGSISLDSLLSSNKSLRYIIWVARAGGKGRDWDEVPETTTKAGGQLNTKTWHDIQSQNGSASKEVPALDKETTPQPLSMFCPTTSGDYELVEYTHANIVAAVAALNSSLPRLHKLGSSDSVLPTIPLSTTYSLTWVLLTLFSGSTLYLTSVAGSEINLLAATKSARQLLKPTYIIADARSIPTFLQNVQSAFSSGGILAQYGRWSLNRSLVQGIMPANTSKPGYLPSSLSSLKTLYIVLPSSVPTSERPTSSTLSTLRLILSARVSLALTAGPVAGYITQTNPLDYRNKKDDVCVGSVASSLELHLTGDESQMDKIDGIGDIVVKGPAVVGGKSEKKVIEGLKARVDLDNTVILVPKSRKVW